MLSLGWSTCAHEQETRANTIDDFIQQHAGIGNSSTLAWRVLPQLREAFPNLRYLWVSRNFSDVAKSCANAGHPEFGYMTADRAWLEAKRIGAMEQKVVNVERLDMEKCEEIWDHLIPDEPFPLLKVRNLLRMNVQLTRPEFDQVTTQPIPWLMEAIA